MKREQARGVISILEKVRRGIRRSFHALMSLSSRQLVALALTFVLIIAIFVSMPARAAIAFRSVSTASTGNGTSIAVPTPAGLAVGDVMVAAFGVQMGYPSQDPSGWTRILATVDTNKNIGQTLYYKVATSADVSTADYTFSVLTATRLTGTISAYTGVDISDPIGASAGQFGNSSTLTAPVVGTVRDGSWVVSAFSHDYGSATTGFGTLAKRYEFITAGGGSAGSKMMSMGGDKVQATAGTAPSSSITVQDADFYIGQSVVLKPALPSTLTQSAYRWFTNVDAANFSVKNLNSTTATDAAYATAQDGTWLYTAGYSGANGVDWQVQKIDLNEGLAAPGFGISGGILDISPSASDDRIWSIDLDSDYMYLAGHDSAAGATNQQWRIEKRAKENGGLVSGFGSGGVVQSNPTTGNDVIREIKVDGNYIYVAGFDMSNGDQIRIEKRDLTTGALVTGFGTNGVVTADYSANSEQASAMVIDGSSMYLGGYDNSPGNNTQIRIEKRDLTTGALVTGFGTNGVVTHNIFTGASPAGLVEDTVLYKGLVLHGGNLYIAGTDYVPGNLQWHIQKRDSTTGALVSGFGSSGVVQSNPSSGDDSATTIRTDGNYLYVGGADRSLDGGTSQFRIEKRDMTTGALVTGFGSTGVVLSNPSTGHDELRDMTITGGNVFAVGYDLSPGNYQWRIEKRSTISGNGPSDAGEPRSALNTPATSVAVGEQVRLRLLLRVGTSQLGVSGQSFRLQFAERSGTCDAGFSGETYANLTNNSTFAMHNNAALSDSSTLYANVNDPTDGANPVILQAYDEFELFSNSTAAIPVNSNGLWDISIKNNSAPLGKTYCFRVVDSTGTPIAGYENIAELSTPPAPELTQANYRWYANADSATPGAPLAPQDTPTIVASGTPFRLRQLLSQTVGTTISGTNFKLQSALKSSTCSAATYSDMSGATESTGFLDGSSGVNTLDATGEQSWSNPQNALTYDGFIARALLPMSNPGGPTERLEVSGFNMNVPGNATITGIEVTVEAVSYEGDEEDLFLMKNNVPVGADRAGAGLMNGALTRGSPTDLWGTTWTPAEINSSGFGASLRGFLRINKDLGDGGWIELDHLAINVYYSLPAGDLVFYDNTSVADDAAISTTGADPVPSSGTVRSQSYNENYTFVTPTQIATGENGIWDTTLMGNASADGKTYCFRIVKDDGTALSGYSYYPEITFSGGGSTEPTLNQMLRGGQSVIDGIKRGFLW